MKTLAKGFLVMLITLTMAVANTVNKAPLPGHPYFHLGVEPSKDDVEIVYLKTLIKTNEYFVETGEPKKSLDYLKKYLDSAWRVSHMIQGFPTTNRVENAHLFLCYGAQESMFDRDFVEINIPGVRLSNGLWIRKFSLDYGWAGLNEQHTEWTYAIAEALQNGEKNIPEKFKHNISGSTWRYLRAHIYIPKGLKLKKIEPWIAKVAKKKWKIAQALGTPVKEFKKKLPLHYEERGPDDLDSMLIYRMIVQIDRMHRRWEYQSWNKMFARKFKAIRLERGV